MNGCHSEPRTKCSSKTTVTGKVLDSVTQKPIRNASITGNIKTDSNGMFHIPDTVTLKITTSKNGPWGCHRSFIVSKNGYTPMFCIRDIRFANISSYIPLTPIKNKVENKFTLVGSGVYCKPYLK